MILRAPRTRGGCLERSLTKRIGATMSEPTTLQLYTTGAYLVPVLELPLGGGR